MWVGVLDIYVERKNKTNKGGVINLDKVLEELESAKSFIEQSTWQDPKGIDDELKDLITTAEKSVENAIDYINDIVLAD